MQILYEDNHLIVVNKACGELVQGDATGDKPLSELLKDFLKEKYGKPGNVFVGVTHRLDRPTSGVVIFAKTSKALERMNRLFQAGEVHKTYHAIVCTPPPVEHNVLHHWLRRDPKLNKSFVVNTSGRGRNNPDVKEAKLEYRLIGRSDRYSLLEIRLFTGRHHQIRAQLASLGCSIKGDLKYGAPRSNPDGGISLHARSVQFMHPVRREPIFIEAPYPAQPSLWAEFTPITPAPWTE